MSTTPNSSSRPMRPISPSIVALLTANFFSAERVADDSLSAPAFKTVAGITIACDAASPRGVVPWCVITSPVNKRGFVLSAPGKFNPISGLSSVIYYRTALLFHSHAAAAQALSEARQCATNKDDIKELDALVPVEVPVSGHDLKFHSIFFSLLEERVKAMPSA